MARTTGEREPSTLSAIFPSTAMGRLVLFFALNPGARVHLREIERRTGLATSSLQNELKRLTELGALTQSREGGRTLYQADESHDAWRGWWTLIRACVDPADVLREAFTGVSGVDAAFIFGSRARGDMRPDSDVDLFIVGDAEAQETLRDLLVDAEFLLGCELDIIECTRDQLAERARSGNAFLRRVLREPKRWIAGSPTFIEAVAA